MAATSSILYATSTTPWPAHTIDALGMLHLLPVRTTSPSNVQPHHVNLPSTVSSAGTIHYAVATSTIAAVYQPPQPPTITMNASLHKKTGPAPKLDRRQPSVKPVGRRELRLRLAKIALSLVGSKYVWGGSTPAGFDCSGLTAFVYRQFGIRLPRTSYDQFATGKPVAERDLEPGDLLFFDTNGGGASHVGIYVGNNLFVQALNERVGVVMGRLTDKYYQARFMGARRIRVA